MKKALIIGIDDYPGAPLKACVNDARRMEKLLSRNEDGSVNFHCLLLASDRQEVTTELMWESIETLLQPPGDAALIYFSGHGTEDILSGYLVSQDARQYSEGVEMDGLIRLCNQSPVPEVVIILDCCYSGKFGNPGGAGRKTAELREGVSILTASMSHQLSWEKNGHGVFTNIIAWALEGSAKDILGNVTVAAVYNQADQLLTAWEQRPMLKSHLSRMALLRRCKPRIHEASLRQLTELFPHEKFEYQLSPQYEFTHPSAEPDKTRIFSLFQQLRDEALLKPIGEKDLYFAAMRSCKCVLTDLGQVYWKMVHKRII